MVWAVQCVSELKPFSVAYIRVIPQNKVNHIILEVIACISFSILDMIKKICFL